MHKTPLEVSAVFRRRWRGLLLLCYEHIIWASIGANVTQYQCELTTCALETSCLFVGVNELGLGLAHTQGTKLSGDCCARLAGSNSGIM